MGSHLGTLAGRGLAARCAEGRLDAKGRAQSRAARKRTLTAASSSRWAGAITRTSEDAWQLADRNLRAERATLLARIRRIEGRLAVQAGTQSGRARGYATPAERHGKTIRLKALKARLGDVERQIADGTPSVVRGGKRLLGKRLSLADAGFTESQWRREWESARLFITADGEKDKTWGNAVTREQAAGTWTPRGRPRPVPCRRWRTCGNRPSSRWT